MPVSDSLQRAINKYNAKAYDQLAIRIPKGMRDEIKDAADAAGKSLASFVREAVEKEIERTK